MPLFFVFQKDAKSQSCNTLPPPSTFKLPAKQYSHNLFGKKNLVALRPFVDTVAITISGKSAFALAKNKNSAGSDYGSKFLSYGVYWDRIKKKLQLAAKGAGKSAIRYSKRPLEKHTNFDVSLPGTDAKLLISIPHNTSYGKCQVRIEFNSQKLNAEGMDKLSEFWAILDNETIALPELLVDAKAKRIDLAFDVLNINISDLCAFSPDIWKVWSVREPFGNLQTEQHHRKQANQKHHFQSRLRKAALIVYDKKAELIDSGSLPIYGDVEHVRMEFYFLSSSKLTNLKSWAPNLENWSLFNLTGSDQKALRQYFDSIRQRGIEAASAMYPSQPSSIAEILKKMPGNLFHPNVLEHINHAVLEGALGRAICLASASVEECT